ncbi:MAG: SHOCT domain-containing protein [Chloroflexota bacterium]
MSKLTWVIVIGVAVLVILSLASSLLIPLVYGRGYGYGWGGMMGPWMMGGFGFPFMGGIWMLLFWVLIIGGVVWLVQSLARGAGQTGTSTPAGELPLDILKRRYAKGEITQEQFEQMKRDLSV